MTLTCVEVQWPVYLYLIYGQCQHLDHSTLGIHRIDTPSTTWPTLSQLLIDIQTLIGQVWTNSCIIQHSMICLWKLVVPQLMVGQDVHLVMAECQWRSSVDRNVNQVSIDAWYRLTLNCRCVYTHYPYFKFYLLHHYYLINNFFCKFYCSGAWHLPFIRLCEGNHTMSYVNLCALNSKLGGILGHNLNKADYLNWLINSERTSGIILILWW